MAAAPGEPLARLTTRAVAALVDEMHRRLAELGYADLRPTHGFVLNALSGSGVTTAELGPLLGMSKQGAAKVVAQLVGLGYVATVTDPDDARARPVVLTERGRAALTTAAEVQRRLEVDLVRAVGRPDVDAARRVLEVAVRRWSGGAGVSLRPLR